MKPSVQKILTKLSQERVDLFTISEAKNILKYEVWEDVNKSRGILGGNIEDLKTFDKKDSLERDALKQKQKKEFDDFLKNQEQKINKIVNTLDSELKQAKSLIKEIDKNIQKNKNIVKQFEKELIDMEIKPSSSKLFQEVEAAVSLLETDKKRMQQAIDFVENDYLYKTNK